MSTKSKVSPTGSSSRIAAARWRISGSISAMPAVEKVGVTTRRCASWSGGSSAMKLESALGSKASALELTNISVEMKVAIEQLREQVQNIE